MIRRKRAVAVAGGCVAALAATIAAGASAGGQLTLPGLPEANTKAPGYAPPTLLSRGLAERPVAQGAMRLENGTAAIPFYGYDGDGPMLPALRVAQTPGHDVEATKTEPDKNTYLRLPDEHGSDPGYDYGEHFLFQGHEHAGKGASGYITRVNLDAAGRHRVTLMATHDSSGKPLPEFDGSTWDPWAHRLLFSAELGADGGIWQATPDFPSTVDDLAGAIGRGSYEGIQNDRAGNLWIVEDEGGPNGTTATHAKQPNSFIYRFKPDDPSDLTRGELQALQVRSLRSGDPIVFHAGRADADISSQDTSDLHSYGHVLRTRWVTLHDTSADGTTPFDANALAKQKGATPFKRPENGQFRPGSRFRQFYFDETGDTDARSQAGADGGGFGAVQRLTQRSPSADTGRLTLVYQNDEAHAAFDNVAFLSRNQIAFVEDAGDTLHTQRNALDSAFVLDVRRDYSDSSTTAPVRFIAEGRDPSATIDSALLADADANGFQNDGDNELTGIHVSDGDPTRGGILGAKVPRPFSRRHSRWRVFYTQQHGDNVTWEVVRAH